MNRHLARLLAIGLLIVSTGVVTVALGYSSTAAVLGMILVAALCWAPTLLTLEAMNRDRED